MPAQIVQLRPRPSPEDIAREEQLRKSFEFHSKMANTFFNAWLIAAEKIGRRNGRVL